MWKFRPILKSTIWGGKRIIPFKRLTPSLSNVGESWEICGVTGNESVVDGGPDDGLRLSQLLDKYKSELLGRRNYEKYGNNFPLLVKFIDARQDLSVQVHPDDAFAQSHGMANGKTEMWYVVKADRGARIANGFNREVDPSEYDKLVESGEIEQTLRYMQARKGDVFIIPAGRVHTICAGLFVAEIQQTSDATYRIYDYHRKDSEGKERELHTELARQAIDFKDTDGEAVKYQARANVPVNVVHSPFFTTNVLWADNEMMRDYTESDTFVILVITEGEASVECGGSTLDVRAGETILVPASAEGIVIRPRSQVTLLESYIK